MGQVFLQAGYLHVGHLSFDVGCMVGCQISGETRRAPAFLNTTGARGYENQGEHAPLVWMQTGSCPYFRVVGLCRIYQQLQPGSAAGLVDQ